MSVNLIDSSDITVSQTNDDISLNLVDRLDMFNDTSGSTWQDMMKNKIDYCIDNIDTTRQNVETFINGGWSGANFGFGIFSKIGTTYQLIWFSSNATYYCRKLGDTYQYTDICSGSKDIITMELTGSQSFGSAYTKLNLSAGTTIGTKLSVSSNQVKIGSGVNHIKVSATLGYNYASAGMRYLRITKNFDTSSIDTTSIALQQTYENSTNHVGTIAITDVVVPVSEGDLIAMYVYGLSGDSARYTNSGMIQTNMTVEVVD